MGHEEVETFGDAFEREEVCIPKGTYDLACLLQGRTNGCPVVWDTLPETYRHYRHYDLDRVNPAVNPPREAVREFAEKWTKHVAEKTNIVTTHIFGWEKICRFVGHMMAATIGNAERRRQNRTGRFFFPEKGLYLYGFPGRFKTYVGREMASFLKIPFYDVFSIDRQWQKSGAEMWSTPAFRDLQCGHCVIDDLGAEAGHKHYGGGSCFPELIKKRMDLLDQRRVITIITSNISPETLGESDDANDKRAHSNILGMCTPILFGGPDARLT